MRVVCAAIDGKNDFEEGFIISDELIYQFLYWEREFFWTSFGEKTYYSKETNGFVNLLSTHLIKDRLSEIDAKGNDK